jgi:microcystin-dependent protein
MGQPYIGEIRMIGCNFAPNGWAFCDGSLQAISQNEALFNLIGTTYGGDGQNTFALPNLLGRAPVHQGTNPGNGITYIIGQLGGVENVTLTPNQMPIHTHPPQAATGISGNPVNSPAGNVWSGWTGGQFTTQTPAAPMAATAVGTAGNSLPHDNLPPFLAINFIISLFGIFPSQT